LTKGDLVTILGTLSYKTIKDEKGFNINQASIVGGFVKKVNAGTSDEPTADEVAKAAEVVSAA
jgi:NCAIR mutase (PurE)-related protein